MKIALQDSKHFILRLDSGEEVLEQLANFAKQQHIKVAVFSGLGAGQELELAFYDLETKTYHRRNFQEDLEIVTLTGNISELNQKPAIHVHGSFSRKDFTTISGHVLKLIISVTCEIILIRLEGHLERKFNPEFNLNLLS